MNQHKENLLILVDENNNQIGNGEKLDVHKAGRLHRAFSLFIYDINDHKILIQRRASGKYHSGGKLANSCCSHPYQNEEIEQALKRAMKDELGLVREFDIKKINEVSEIEPDDTIYFLDSFKYFSDYGEMKEHELDSVYLYPVTSLNDLNLNANEVEEALWLSTKEIDERLRKNQDEFSSWFPMAYDITKKETNLF